MKSTIARIAMVLEAQRMLHTDVIQKLQDEMDSLYVDAPDDVCDPVYEPSRKRAQWKNETNYRGRNR